MSESKELEKTTQAEADAEAREADKVLYDKKFGITAAGIIIALSVFLIFIDLTTLEFFNNMRIFGPGAFPAFVFGTLILLNIWNIVEIATGKGGSAKLSNHIEFAKIKKALRLFVCILGALLLMQLAGFVLAMMAFTFVEMMFLSEKKVKRPYIVICTVIVPFSIYFIFAALNINLPSPSWMPF